MSKDVLAWHFVGDALRDGRPIPADGVTLKHKGKLELCASGLHASERLIDALQYAPGPILCRVQMGGAIKEESDKLVARQRTIFWRIDSTDVLQKFARQCALDVAHLWNMPPVVRQYLETGDESIIDAAKAARAAVKIAWGAIGFDSAATSEAAKAAAMYAFAVVDRGASWAAVEYSALETAREAARQGCRAAAWNAASYGAQGAASIAARAAAKDAQNIRLTEMVMALAPEKS